MNNILNNRQKVKILNTVHTGDNLKVMRFIEDKFIDLIYLDPPYYSQTKYKNKDNEFSDNWKDIDEYLNFMKVRIVEMHRILKSTGSIYLHVDYHAVFELKILMDEIFSRTNFRNEIIWHYGLGAANAKSTYLKKHDNILFYSKNKEYTFNLQRGDVTPQMRAKYCHKDENGKFMMSKGKRYYLKGGKPLDSVWDIPTLSPTAKERVDYPTQKPLELLERIINVSSNKGDIVLDPFCGSGTTLKAAKNLERNYIGIDEQNRATEISKKRNEK